MPKTRFFSVFAVIGCVVSTNSFALDLSLDSAIEKIIAQSQDLKKADASVAQAKASLDAANSARWFKIDANANYTSLINMRDPFGSYNIDLPPELGGLIMNNLNVDVSTLQIPDNMFSAGVSITQPIYTFGKIGNAVDSVRSAIRAADAGRDMTMRGVEYAAKNLYWTAKMTEEIVRISTQDLSDTVSAKQQLTAAGRAHRSNLVKIESDIAAKEIALSDAKFNRDTAHRMLKILSGIDIAEELVLTDAFPSTFADLSAKELETTPEWEILGEQIKMYDSKARSSRAGAYPTLAAFGSYSYNALGTEIDNMFSASNSQSANVGVSLQVPLWSGGLHRANATIDAMSAEAVRQDLDKSKLLLREEYTRGIDEYNHLRGNLSGLNNARALAAKAYSFSRDRFAAGQTSAVELADVSAGLYQLDMALLNAKYKILMSAASVEKIGE